MSALAISIIGGDKLVAKLRTGATTLTEALRQEMANQMARAADWSRANRLSGDPLHRRSGQLSQSLTADADIDGTVVRGILGSPMPYAHVHERGGIFSIPSHSAVSRRGNTFEVAAHSARYPQRAFLKPALVASRDQILQGLRTRIMQVMR